MTKLLPEKVDGEHRWVVISVHTVTPEQLEEYPVAYLVVENNVYNRTIGCVDCEISYPSDSPCTKGDMLAGD